MRLPVFSAIMRGFKNDSNVDISRDIVAQWNKPPLRMPANLTRVPGGVIATLQLSARAPPPPGKAPDDDPGACVAHERRR